MDKLKISVLMVCSAGAMIGSSDLVSSFEYAWEVFFVAWIIFAIMYYLSD